MQAVAKPAWCRLRGVELMWEWVEKPCRPWQWPYWPWVWLCWPVRIQARLTAQEGEVQKALSKTTPCCAKVSMRGVFTAVSP